VVLMQRVRDLVRCGGHGCLLLLLGGERGVC
jgi:hypothetical protein